MSEKSHHERNGVSPAQDTRPSTAPGQHPTWCDRHLCTADPASQANGYHHGAGGEHRSAPVPLDLTGACLVPANIAQAYLSQAVAPWPCAIYLRVRVAAADLSMPVEYAAPQLSALLMLAMAGQAGGEV